MKLKKETVKRKRYATEFLIRSENPNLVEQIKKVAGRLSVNSFILDRLDEAIKKSK